jgi:myo-inositol catabolism protein IolC
VLERDADEAQVLEWLRIAASVPGFDGFAVGRTLWEEPLRDLVAGTTERSAAVHEIAARYLETVNGFAVSTLDSPVHPRRQRGYPIAARRR